MRYAYTVGPGNGIYKWAFYGDKEMPIDILEAYEKLPDDIAQHEAKENDIPVPAFEQEQLATYTE